MGRVFQDNPTYVPAVGDGPNELTVISLQR
jgi:hypothetical protein